MKSERVMDKPPDREMLEDAAKRIEPYIRHTPVMTCKAIDEAAGVRIVFKCEQFQKVGAFKYRGATNALNVMNDGEAASGVATHSSGNHAQALALAASIRQVPAYIVMPENSPEVKIRAVESYGAEIIFCEATLEARETTLRKVVEETGASFVHPYNDYRIIAGQATAAMELIEQAPDLDYLMAPVGGGGLLSGSTLAARYFAPGLRVIAGEPARADDAIRSMQLGRIVVPDRTDTIADGLRTSLGTKTFPIIKEGVARILPASEEGIVSAMRMLWERAKLLVEPSAAVCLAALIENEGDWQGRKIGIILSGGNVDLDHLPWN